VGTHSRVAELRAQRRSQGADLSGRHTRASWTLPAFATFVTCAFVAGTLAAPGDDAFAAPVVLADGDLATQSLKVDGQYTNAAGRDAFTITAPPPPEPEPVAAAASSGAPAAGTPDPGTAQAIAYDMVMARGWGQGEFDCLVSLWNKESHWNVYAHNASSGAYGIPQALPGDKMASAGADWATNPATQITWGLGYITNRYGTPCGAWSTSEAQGWY
jgi:hypothetical protein